MLKIKALIGFAGSDVSACKDEVIEVDESFGKEMIKIGYAEEVKENKGKPKKKVDSDED